MTEKDRFTSIGMILSIFKMFSRIIYKIFKHEYLKHKLCNVTVQEHQIKTNKNKSRYALLYLECNNNHHLTASHAILAKISQISF